jgi:hypothetical protein
MISFNQVITELRRDIVAYRFAVGNLHDLGSGLVSIEQESRITVNRGPERLFGKLC